MSNLAQLRKDFQGVHNILVRDYSTHLNPMMLHVIDGVNIDLSQKTIALKGGTMKDKAEVDIVDNEGKLSFTAAEAPDSVLQEFFQAVPTVTAAETAGAVGLLTNTIGTSIATAITTVAATATKKPVEGTYRIVAATTGTIAIYANTDVDRTINIPLYDASIGQVNVGTAAIPAGTVTLTTGTIDIPALGITLTVGATQTVTLADAAEIVLARPNTSQDDIDIGGELPPGYKEVWCFMGENMVRDLGWILLYRCAVSRGKMESTIKKYHTFEFNVEPTTDPVLGKIGKLHRSNNT
jgi:hypothetical protein